MGQNNCCGNNDVVQNELVKTVKKKFSAAVLLAGSGVYDGSECTEAVSALVSLARHETTV